MYHRNASENLAEKKVSVQKNKSSTSKSKGYCWSQKPVSIPSGYGRKRMDVLGFLDAVTHQVLKVMETAAHYEIVLVFLPPYSSNLNLIERFWKFLRKDLLSVRYYDSFDQFFNAISEFADNASAETSPFVCRLTLCVPRL